MRCREAQRLLNEGDISHPDLPAHISRCEKCAREAAAAGMLERVIGAIRGENPDATTPLAQIRARVESPSAASPRKEHSRMAKITHTLTAKKRLGFGLGLAVAALLFFTLVPFSYDRVVGYDVTIGNLPAYQQIQINRILAGFEAIGIENASVSVNHADDAASVYMMNFTDHAAAQKATAAFNTLTGLNGEIDISPRMETVSGSLFAQVQEKLTRIEVSASGGTTEEMQAEIEAQLAAKGFEGASAIVTVDEVEGTKTIQITIPGDE